MSNPIELLQKEFDKFVADESTPQKLREVAIHIVLSKFNNQDPVESILLAYDLKEMWQDVIENSDFVSMLNDVPEDLDKDKLAEDIRNILKSMTPDYQSIVNLAGRYNLTEDQMDQIPDKAGLFVGFMTRNQIEADKVFSTAKARGIDGVISSMPFQLTLQEVKMLVAQDILFEEKLNKLHK